MKVSDLIAELKTVLEQEGNLDVVMFSDEEGNSCATLGDVQVYWQDSEDDEVSARVVTLWPDRALEDFSLYDYDPFEEDDQ